MTLRAGVERAVMLKVEEVKRVELAAGVKRQRHQSFVGSISSQQ